MAPQSSNWNRSIKTLGRLKTRQSGQGTNNLALALPIQSSARTRRISSSSSKYFYFANRFMTGSTLWGSGRMSTYTISFDVISENRCGVFGGITTTSPGPTFRLTPPTISPPLAVGPLGPTLAGVFTLSIVPPVRERRITGNNMVDLGDIRVLHTATTGG